MLTTLLRPYVDPFSIWGDGRSAPLLGLADRTGETVERVASTDRFHAGFDRGPAGRGSPPAAG